MAISAIVLAGQGTWWQMERQRDKEQELLFVGNQFRQAIAGYYESTPGPVKRYPASLNDLLLDQRFLPARRHLRRVYLDPITNAAKWGQVRAPDGGVMGVYSISSAQPFKTEGFAERDFEFTGKKHYSDWTFFYTGQRIRYVPPVMLPWTPYSEPSVVSPSAPVQR